MVIQFPLNDRARFRLLLRQLTTADDGPDPRGHHIESDHDGFFVVDEEGLELVTEPRRFASFEAASRAIDQMVRNYKRQKERGQ